MRMSAHSSPATHIAHLGY